MLQENNPDAAGMYEIQKKDGEKERCCTLLRLEIQASPSSITPASAALWVWLYIFAGQIGISSFVLRTQRAVYTLDDKLALVNSVCCLRCRALVGTYLLCCFGQA